MLSYTAHARKRMRQRSISEHEVEYCIDNHTVEYSDKEGNPIYIVYTPSNRYIKVVVDKNSKKSIKVITVGD